MWEVRRSQRQEESPRGRRMLAHGRHSGPVAVSSSSLIERVVASLHAAVFDDSIRPETAGRPDRRGLQDEGQYCGGRRRLFEARHRERIVEGLRTPGRTSEQMLDVITFRRADGTEVDLAEFPLTSVLLGAETVRGEEILASTPDGRKVTMLVNTTPVRSADGAIEQVIVTMQDLAPIQELERLRSQFLGMVSHELRAPLTSIKGSAATLLETGSDLDPAVMREFHRIIAAQADQPRRPIT